MYTGIVWLIVGLCLFLLGMKLMELAMTRLAGPGLSRVLQRFTATPIRGLITGALASALLQSSTAITVITIGMVNAGWLAFSSTLGIILGTNIGTCITTELISLNISGLAGPILIIACGAWLLSAFLDEMGFFPGIKLNYKRLLPALRYGALALCGFSMLLLGITAMQSIGAGAEKNPALAAFLQHAGNQIWWGLLASAIMTALIHSSAAVIAMVMAMAMTGSITPDLAVAMVLGANVGTCGTAILASISGTTGGRLVALSHLVLNLFGALLFMPFTSELAMVASWFASNQAAMVAHAQTLFNVLCSLLALPLLYLPVFRKQQRASDLPPSGVNS